MKGFIDNNKWILSDEKLNEQGVQTVTYCWYEESVNRNIYTFFYGYEVSVVGYKGNIRFRK